MPNERPPMFDGMTYAQMLRFEQGRGCLIPDFAVRRAEEADAEIAQLKKELEDAKDAANERQAARTS